MVDPRLVPAVKEAIKQNEIGNASPRTCTSIT